MNKREKYLLGILIALIIAFGYYKVIYLKQAEKLKVKIEERDLLKEKYDTAIESINNLESKKKEVYDLSNKILKDTESLYPNILQEKVISELDGLLVESNLKGDIIFSEIEVKSIENLASLGKNKEVSTIQNLVDEYNKVGNSSNQEVLNENSEEKESSNENQGVEEAKATEGTVENFMVGIKFNGSYEEIKKFVEIVEKSKRKVAITDITINATSETILSGTMTLEYHGVPKIDNSLEDYKETLNKVYGKDGLFSSGNADGSYFTLDNEEEAEEDFFLVLKSNTSEMNKLTIGLSKDNSSKLTSNNIDEEIEVILNEENEKFFYKYKTLESYYPLNYEEKEFNPNSKKIVLNILSEIRGSASDIGKVNFKIINNTTKDVEIIIENEDDKNPRIEIKTEGNTVNITKK